MKLYFTFNIYATHSYYVKKTPIKIILQKCENVARSDP